MMTLACKDMGIESCDFVAKAETAEEVLKMGAEHAMASHADKMEEMKKTMTEDQMMMAAKAAMKSE